MRGYSQKMFFCTLNNCKIFQTLCKIKEQRINVTTRGKVKSQKITFCVFIIISVWQEHSDGPRWFSTEQWNVFVKEFYEQSVSMKWSSCKTPSPISIETIYELDQMRLSCHWITHPPAQRFMAALKGKFVATLQQMWFFGSSASKLERLECYSYLVHQNLWFPCWIKAVTDLPDCIKSLTRNITLI